MGIRWFPYFDTLQIKIPKLHFGKRVRGRLDPQTVFFEGDFGNMPSFVPDPLTRRQVVSKRAAGISVSHTLLVFASHHPMHHLDPNYKYQSFLPYSPTLCPSMSMKYLFAHYPGVHI